MNYSPQFRIKGKPVRPKLSKADTRLFLIVVQLKGWMPYTSYLFAENRARAVIRFLEALDAMIAHAKTKPDSWTIAHLSNLTKVKNEAKIRAIPVVTSDILVAGQVWASNEGLSL